MTALGGRVRGEVSASAALGELVSRRPARAELFERLRLDYCCGGALTLAEACAKRGLDAETVGQLIAAADAAADLPARLEARDWRSASLTELCDHIVDVHHDGLRRDLPQIAELIDSVMRVHGGVDVGLRELPMTFRALRDELGPHLELEERALFPVCRALEADGLPSGLGEEVLDGLEHDHHEVGETLARLRELTSHYDTARALCRTHHRLLEKLRCLELELHQHVHEENNILLPGLRALLWRGRDRIAAAPTHRRRPQVTKTPTERDDLPICCRGWLGEQFHREISPRGPGHTRAR
jgi:regulator of cell morphogenesis and NO signaling